MPPLLGKARIVDDPGLDRPVALQRRPHHLAHLGQDLLIRPGRLADKMQQRLMLRPGPGRGRQRGHRLNALALARRHQPHAVVVQRPAPIRMPEHAAKPRDINLKSRFGVVISA
jgi:hypothetical protein